jgi:putative nucleotidyltransferase with HDIG domain
MEARRDPLAFRAFVVLLLGGTLTMCAALFLTAPWTAWSTSPVRDAIVFASLGLVAEQMAVSVSKRITVAAGNLPILLAMMFCGPGVAAGVGLTVGLWGVWKERSLFLALFNVANFGLSAAVGSVGFAVVADAAGSASSNLGVVLVAGAVAAVLYEVTNILLTSVGAKLEYGLDMRSLWRSEIRSLLQSLAVLTGLGLAIAALYMKAGIISVVLLFAPLLASQYMFKLLVREKEHLARQKELSDQYLEMNIGLAAAMVVLIDSKDEYTANHSAAVAMFCRDMARVVGMGEEEIEAVHLAGLLHDLGKVGTPDAILRKEGTLSEEEWCHIREHPGKGAEVLSHLATYRDVADIVRYHHERLDGSGYPDGLRDGDIPEGSRMLAVADTYHAITSDRPYRPARSSFEALKEIRGLAGVKLDTAYVEALARVLKDKNLSYREGSAADFMDEFRRGRVNLRLREGSLSGATLPERLREDPTAL